MSEFAFAFTVPHSHPSLAGHFPGRPIVPGVLLLQFVLEHIQESLPRSVSLKSIPSSKFLRPVAPGERVDAVVRVAQEASQSLRARFQLSSGGQPVAEGSFLLGDVP